MNTATGSASVSAARIRGRTVADALVRHPKVCDAETRVGEIRHLFEDDHVHAALLVFPDGRLRSVVDRADLTPALPDSLPAHRVGALEGRLVAKNADLEQTWHAMRAAGRRRLAVIQDGYLVGLLCLKRTGLGFCTDADVENRSKSKSTQVPEALGRG